MTKYKNKINPFTGRLTKVPILEPVPSEEYDAQKNKGE